MSGKRQVICDGCGHDGYYCPPDPTCVCQQGRIAVSFSGGRSSALMCELLLKKHPRNKLIFIFMNTGEEHWKTLEFVKKCDEHYGLNLVYLEAVVHPGRKSCTHKVVTYDTLSRRGEPYEAIIKKYGIPNLDFPHCTRELKTNPFNSYMRSTCWEPGTFKVALGIRADEPDRIKPPYIYPLNEAGIDKQAVLDHWKAMPFDLGIEEREGNCVWCWKKTDKKHVLNIQKNPEWYDFPERMEELYALNRTDLLPDARSFFRGRRTTKDMRKLADTLGPIDPRHDSPGPCEESCEVFI